MSLIGTFEHVFKCDWVCAFAKVSYSELVEERDGCGERTTER